MNITFLKAFFLAALQGLTEFLPVSSSGHLVIVQKLLELNDLPVLFDLILHVGTLIAVVIFYWHTIVIILKDTLWYFVSIKDKNKRGEIWKRGNIKILIFIFISTFITGVMGLIFSDRITGFFYRPSIVAIFLIITGIILSSTIFVKRSNLDIKDKGIMFPIIVGLSQSFAMLPGISRSGTTISTALFFGVNREKAGEYSFLISIPSILGATFYMFFKNRGVIVGDRIYIYIFAFVVSLLSGFLALKILVVFLRRGKMYLFSIYCFIIGIISLLFIR